MSQKIIYEDIAILQQLKTSSLQQIENTYKLILSSSSGELNANKLASTLSKSYDQIIQYITWLEEAGLINTLHINKPGKAQLKAPKKLLPNNTNLMAAAFLPYDQDGMIGKMRETFFINQTKHAGYHMFYSKQGDFMINDTVFEIGGKNKNSAQIKNLSAAYVVADGILVGHQNTIPLYLFGLLY